MVATWPPLPRPSRHSSRINGAYVAPANNTPCLPTIPAESPQAKPHDIVRSAQRLLQHIVCSVHHGRLLVCILLLKQRGCGHGRRQPLMRECRALGRAAGSVQHQLACKGCPHATLHRACSCCRPCDHLAVCPRCFWAIGATSQLPRKTQCCLPKPPCRIAHRWRTCLGAAAAAGPYTSSPAAAGQG